MKILVAYASRFGNTEKVAQGIAEGLGSGHEVTAKRVEEVAKEELRSADVLVLGSPTHAWGPSEEMKKLLGSLQAEEVRGKLGAAFDTRFSWPISGSAAKGMEKSLRKLGLRIAAPCFSAVVSGMKGPLRDGELERAKEFGAALLKGLEGSAGR